MKSERRSLSCASINSRARLRPTKQIVYRANKIILKIGPRPFALFAKNSWSVRQLSEKSRRPGGSRQRWLSDRATDQSDRATDQSVGQRVNAASIPNNLRINNVASAANQDDIRGAQKNSLDVIRGVTTYEFDVQAKFAGRTQQTATPLPQHHQEV